MGKYLTLISETKDSRESKELAVQEKRAKLQIQSDILETQSLLDQAEEKLAKAKRSVPFNAKNVIVALNEVTDYQSGLKALNDLDAELFGDPATPAA